MKFLIKETNSYYLQSDLLRNLIAELIIVYLIVIETVSKIIITNDEEIFDLPDETEHAIEVEGRLPADPGDEKARQWHAHHHPGVGAAEGEGSEP